MKKITGGESLVAAEAGFGDVKKVEKGIIHDGCDGLDIKICPDLLLAGLAVAAAGFFIAIYMAITGGRRRRRRKKRSNLVPAAIEDIALLGSSCSSSSSYFFKHVDPFV